MLLIIIMLVLLALCIWKQVADYRNGGNFDVLSYFCFVYELCLVVVFLGAIPGCDRISTAKYDFNITTTEVSGVSLGDELEDAIIILEKNGIEYDIEYQYTYPDDKDKDWRWKFSHPIDSTFIGLSVEWPVYLGVEFYEGYYNFTDGRVDYIALVERGKAAELKKISKGFTKALDENFGNPDKGLKFYGKKDFLIEDKSSGINITVDRWAVYREHEELGVVIFGKDTELGYLPFDEPEDVDYDYDEYDRMPF